VEAATGKEKWRFQAGKDDLIHNQIGFQSSAAVVGGVVYTGCRDSNVYALDAATGKEKWRANNQGSWVNSTPAVSDGKVYFATSDSSLFHAVDAATGKPVFQQQLKAYVFSSPSIAGDVVYLGILNGTMDARDRRTGELLWSFQTETAKQNRNWVLTADGKLNPAMFFRSNWHEGPLVAADREFAIGAIFSAPLIAGGVVYVGSADGFLYALE
jgi:outer membrane protein assembly factor BamB